MPTANLTELRGSDPLADACADLSGGHPQWFRLWLTLATAYPGRSEVLQIGLSEQPSLQDSSS